MGNCPSDPHVARCEIHLCRWIKRRNFDIAPITRKVTRSVAVQFEPRAFGRRLHAYPLIQLLLPRSGLFELFVVAALFGCLQVCLDRGLDVFPLLFDCAQDLYLMSVVFQPLGFVEGEVSSEASQGSFAQDEKFFGYTVAEGSVVRDYKESCVYLLGILLTNPLQLNNFVSPKKDKRKM